MARFAFGTAGLITANASELRAAAVHELGADPRKFALIAYGVDPEALKPEPAGAASLRRQLGIPHDAIVLLASSGIITTFWLLALAISFRASVYLCATK